MKYEYRQMSPNELVSLAGYVLESLNKMGEDGWELCCTIDGPPLYLYFKRRVENGK